MTTRSYFATCARGLEPLLANELHNIGAEQVREGRGGCDFVGDRVLMYKANLWLRTAVRVLVPIGQAKIMSPEELYDWVRSFDWQQYMTVDHTLAVDCNVRDSRITHSLYASRRVKDAICDQFRDKLGARPSVDPETPMIGLNLHIAKNHAILSLDTSWNSLHKRGYRPALTRAPINEALAAGLLLQLGFNGECPLIDPMCGSGAIAIEGAWIALNRPPGLTRKWFSFMGWLDFDPSVWSNLREDARENVRKTLPFPVLGSDLREDVTEFAHGNARNAGIGHLIPFTTKAIQDFQPPEGPPGIVIINPPYGERLEEMVEVTKLYREVGQVFRERCQGWRCCVFTALDAPWKELDLPIKKKYPLWNGKIACHLLEFNP